jgi:predicted transcriptional regulator of viral defense system
MTKTEMIYRTIESSPFKQMTFRGVSNRVGIKSTSLSKFLGALVEQGRLTHVKSGKDGVYAVNKKSIRMGR